MLRVAGDFGPSTESSHISPFRQKGPTAGKDYCAPRCWRLRAFTLAGLWWVHFRPVSTLEQGKISAMMKTRAEREKEFQRLAEDDSGRYKLTVGRSIESVNTWDVFLAVRKRKEKSIPVLGIASLLLAIPTLLFAGLYIYGVLSALFALVQEDGRGRMGVNRPSGVACGRAGFCPARPAGRDHRLGRCKTTSLDGRARHCGKFRCRP